RDHIAIGPTNPSITIQGASGDYLKLTPYYNGGLDGLKRTEIIFKDGASINISGMILSIYEWSLKFPRQNISRRLTSFPFMPRDVSVPS
ncbi:MAG TPA: hypothetical protein VGM31_09115, partial [Puia sp.]